MILSADLRGNEAQEPAAGPPPGLLEEVIQAEKLLEDCRRLLGDEVFGALRPDLPRVIRNRSLKTLLALLLRKLSGSEKKLELLQQALGAAEEVARDLAGNRGVTGCFLSAWEDVDEAGRRRQRCLVQTPQGHQDLGTMGPALRGTELAPGDLVAYNLATQTALGRLPRGHQGGIWARFVRFEEHGDGRRWLVVERGHGDEREALPDRSLLDRLAELQPGIHQVLLDPQFPNVARAIRGETGNGARRSPHSDKAPEVTLDGVGGHEQVKAEIRRMLRRGSDPARAARLGLNRSRALLFIGRIGLGKTLLASATAGTLGARLTAVSMGNTGSPYVAETERNLLDAFERSEAFARADGHHVLFFDELEMLFPDFDGNGAARPHAWDLSLHAEMLTRLDGVTRRLPGLVVLAATYRPWALSAGISRRFRHLLLRGPACEVDVEDLLRCHLPEGLALAEPAGELASRLATYVCDPGRIAARLVVEGSERRHVPVTYLSMMSGDVARKIVERAGEMTDDEEPDGTEEVAIRYETLVAATDAVYAEYFGAAGRAFREHGCTTINPTNYQFFMDVEVGPGVVRAIEPAVAPRENDYLRMA